MNPKNKGSWCHNQKSVFYFKYSLKPFNKHFAYIDYRMNAPFISFTH